MKKFYIALYFMILGAWIEALLIGMWFHFNNEKWVFLTLGVLLILLGLFEVFDEYERL